MRPSTSAVPVFAGLLAGVLGCSAPQGDDMDPSPTQVVDVPEDPSDGPAECQPRFGRTYIMDSVAFLPLGEGTDLDGDGAVDNALGLLADFANPGWVESLAMGNTIVLWDFPGWQEPQLGRAPGQEIAWYQGIDEDRPPDPSNNLSGKGHFLVPASQFDVACNNEVRVAVTRSEGGALAAEAPWLTIYEPQLGTIELADVRVSVQFASDFTRFSASVAGVITLCGLSNTWFPGPTPGTMLDFMINGLVMQADIDRDGDGIERVLGDGTSVARCVDGDGTVIEGPSCPCDPRIADGYSVALQGTAVPATIVGVAQAQ